MNENQSSLAPVNDITNAVQQLLQKTLTDLKGSVATHAAGEPRLFFPNGIELISVVVKIGPADVEVTIAGEKGIKAAGSGTMRMPLIVQHNRDVNASGDSEVMHHNDQILWFNNGTHDVSINFDVNGCPLDACSFTVPKNGGTKLTTVTTNVAKKYEYHHPIVALEGADGGILSNPRIIIQ
jgi:hypothetical protein